MAQFNGTWALNQAKSDSTDELLTAQGVGWIKRKAMNSMSQTMTITINGDQLTIKQETSLNTSEFTITLGGEPVEFTDDLHGKQAKRSAKLEGDALIVVTEGPDGILTVKRTVEGNVLNAHITFTNKADGKETVCKRQFDKK